MYVVGLLIALGYCSDVLWQHKSERLRLREDEGLQVIAGDVVEVCAVGDDCLDRHC